MSYRTGVSLLAELKVVPLHSANQVDVLPSVLETDTSSHMATDREYVDLKLEAAEARTETRFVELNAKLDRMLQAAEALQGENVAGRAELRQEYRSTRNTVLATGLALAALLIGVITYGDAIFSRGMNVRDVIATAQKDQAERSASPSTSAAKPITPKAGQ